MSTITAIFIFLGIFFIQGMIMFSLGIDYQTQRSQDVLMDMYNLQEDAICSKQPGYGYEGWLETPTYEELYKGKNI